MGQGVGLSDDDEVEGPKQSHCIAAAKLGSSARVVSKETRLEKQKAGSDEGLVESAVLVAQLNNTAPTRQIERAIEKLEISADAKALLLDMSRITMKVGQAVLSLGKAILTFVLDILKRFPYATFGIVVGVTVAVIVGSIPLVGAILGPLLGKLVAVFGLTAGTLIDFKDAAIRFEIAGLEEKLSLLSNGV